MVNEQVAQLNAAFAGRYRIIREVGEGGMARIYIAEDLKHDRSVAVKVLRSELTGVVGPERFLAEIKTTANLQHPHILSLFDSGEANGFLFYVMPFVAGESLRVRLDREHQLPVDEAVKIAGSVAEALDYAHRQGVIHRDIKPENILIHDGEPMLADFGIALAVGKAAGSRLTETGLSLGTPLYMSPEQATGEESIGAATDIYALSCVLYEMLVGEPPNKGSTPQIILGRILAGEPSSAASLRKSVPANVDAALRKGLEKVPADRFFTARAFAQALREPAFRYGESASGASPAARLTSRLAVAAAALIAVLALSGWGLYMALAGSRDVSVARFNLTPVEAQSMLPSSSGLNITISPDGKKIVYAGVAADGNSQLWLRRLERMDAEPIPGSQSAFNPDFSPDGESLVFNTGGAIKTLPLTGGLPVTVAQGFAPRWGDDGKIYFVHGAVIQSVALAGGEPRDMTVPATNTIHRQPEVLPDNRGLLFVVQIGPPAQSKIAVVGPEGGEAREILSGVMARYSNTGHILYVTARGTLMAAPFDLRRLEVTGPSVAVAENIAMAGGSLAQFTLSKSGDLLYVTGEGIQQELVWVNREGIVEPVDTSWTGDLGSPILSPDGQRVALSIQGESTMDIWIKQLDKGPSTRLTVDGQRNDYPAWTPDGLSVTFPSNRANPSFDLWTMRADGSSEPLLEQDEDRAIAEPLWTPDGQWLISRTSTNERGAGDLLIKRRGSKEAATPLVASRFTELGPALSPNGRWLAFTSAESGTYEIYVVPFPRTADAKWPVSVAGGTEAAWSRDGRELFYKNGHGDMVAVSVRTEGPTFSIDSSKTLFSAEPYASEYVRRQYDVSLDGRRFLMIRPVGGGSENNLVMVINFAQELKSRVAK